MKNDILVIAHRGASGNEPENTMRAFEMASQMGADGLELDIFQTKDNRLVVTHNQNTFQITGRHKNIRQSTFAELQSLDFGKGEKIPLLENVFKKYLKRFSVINVEIKPAGYCDTGIETNLVSLIKKFDCVNKVLISSFNPIHLYRVKKSLKNVKTGYLLCEKKGFLAKNKWIINYISPDTINIDHNLHYHKRFEYLFKIDKPKWVWTINDTKKMKYWIKQRPRAIITNHPDKLIAMLSS